MAKHKESRPFLVLCHNPSPKHGKKGKKDSAKGDHSDGYPPAEYYTRKGGKDGKGKSKGKDGSK